MRAGRMRSLGFAGVVKWIMIGFVVGVFGSCLAELLYRAVCFEMGVLP